MIITRSPLRISLGGGGTDLPSYYRDHTGFLVAAAIDRHVHIVINRSILPEMILKYSQTERVTDVSQIQHPLVREAMRLVGVPAEELEIAAMADIPAGTGLGSSGSFCTALLRGLHALRDGNPSAAEIAEQACHIEIDRLKEPVGKQDQFIAAVGGVTCFRFNSDGHVEYWPLRASAETLRKLEHNLVLYFTGYTRSASEVLREQDTKTKAADSSMIDNLHFIKDLGFKSKDCAGSRRPARVRGADERSLAVEEEAQRGHVELAHRRVVRVGARQRRVGRQVDRRGRRRVPDVLHRGRGAPDFGDERRRVAERAV